MANITNSGVTTPTQRRFLSEAVVARIYGFSRRTLQKDRALKRNRFPWHKVLGKILYDLDEVEAIVRSTVQDGPCVPRVTVEMANEAIK
jgi:hypothetical protein